MMNTGRLLVKWSCARNAGVLSFAGSALARSTQMLLPFQGMDIRRSGGAFSIFHPECRGECGDSGRKRYTNKIYSMHKRVLLFIGLFFLELD